MLAFAAFAVSCVKNNTPNSSGSETDPNTQTYSTVQNVTANIDYTAAQSSVLFYVYDQNPIKASETTPGTLDKTIQALDAAYTDDNGKFTGTLHLPAYVTDVYVVSATANGERLMKGTVSNGTLTVSDTNDAVMLSATKAKVKTASKYSKGRFAVLGWDDALGTYDSSTGEADYVNSADISLTSGTSTKKLVSLANNIFHIDATLEEIYRTQEDLLTSGDNTELTMMIIMGNTCWNSPVGYYYYEDGSKPASVSDCHVYTVLPNTQTNVWNNGYLKSYPQGVKIGDKVQLKYYGLDGKSTGTKYFPKGIRVGFLLANNMWDYYFNGFTDKDTYTKEGKIYYAASTPSISGSGFNTTLTTQTAMFRDASYPNDIIIGFEDHFDDENFEDIVFAFTSNPAIKNVATVNSSGTLARLDRYGFYAFEDLWPKTGDFDMNDVMANYKYSKYFNNSNHITKEMFSFTLYQNVATNKNGIGFMFDNTPSGAEVTVTKDGSNIALNSEQDGKVILLTDDVKTGLGSTYVVTVDYGSSSTKTAETAINTFIYRASDKTAGKRWELHLPMQKPTDKMDYAYFGTDQDASVPASNIFYVFNSGGKFPFAFYLENATDENVSALRNANNESVIISQLYPEFAAWALDNTKNKNWYKITSGQ